MVFPEPSTFGEIPLLPRYGWILIHLIGIKPFFTLRRFFPPLSWFTFRGAVEDLESRKSTKDLFKGLALGIDTVSANLRENFP